MGFELVADFGDTGGASALAVEFGGMAQGLRLAAGSAQAQESWFGLESTGTAPLSLTGEGARFNAPFLAFATAGAYSGAYFSLSERTGLRIGVLAQDSKGDLSGLAQDQSSRKVSVLEFEHSHGQDPLRLTAVATLGKIQESNGALGLSGSGVFATKGGADTEFASFAATQALGANTRASFMLAYGRSSTYKNSARSSAFKMASAVKSVSWSLGLARSNLRVAGDQLGATVSMPLRARSGHITLDGASSQSQIDGSLHFERREVSLVPSGKERRVEIAYSAPVRGGHVSVQANVRLQPGHIARARADAGFGVRLQKAF